MTLRNRNRINIALFTLSLIILFSYLSITIFRIIDKSFSLPSYSTEVSSSFITGFKPYFAFAAIYIEVIFACFFSYFILHNFEKTQSANIIFFYLFLLACICDSARFYIPMFNLPQAYTKLMFYCGRLVLFGRLLAPFSLFAIATMTEESQFQDIERNCFLILIVSLFFAISIPLNITKINHDYSVAFAFRKLIMIFSIILTLLNICAVYIKNREHGRNQKTTIGFTLLSFGFFILCSSSILVHLVAGTAFIISGTFIYLTDLHKQYLWQD